MEVERSPIKVLGQWGYIEIYIKVTSPKENSSWLDCWPDLLLCLTLPLLFCSKCSESHIPICIACSAILQLKVPCTIDRNLSFYRDINNRKLGVKLL